MAGTGDQMIYHKTSMTTLFDNLIQFHKDLTTQRDDITAARQKVEEAWATGSIENFKTVAGKWDSEFETSLQVLNRVALAVESALHRALATDNKVGNAFDGLAT